MSEVDGLRQTESVVVRTDHFLVDVCALDIQQAVHSTDIVFITVRMDPTGLILGLMLRVDVAAGVGQVQMQHHHSLHASSTHNKSS